MKDLRAIDFLNLLNKGEHEIFNFLFPFFGPKLAKPFLNDQIELYLLDYGLDVFYTDGKVGDSVAEAFMFHMEGSEDHKAFPGLLPNNILFGMNDMEVSAILGPPSRQSIPFSWVETKMDVHPLTLSFVLVYDYGQHFWTYNFAENKQLVKINVGPAGVIRSNGEWVPISARLEENNIIRY